MDPRRWIPAFLAAFLLVLPATLSRATDDDPAKIQRELEEKIAKCLRKAEEAQRKAALKAAKREQETREDITEALQEAREGRYWRLIVPGSGLLRRQWLDGIKRRAESAGQGRRASDAQPRGL